MNGRWLLMFAVATLCGGPAWSQDYKSDEAKKAWDDYTKSVTEAERKYLAEREQAQKQYVEKLRAARKKAIEKDDVDEAQQLLLAEKSLSKEPIPAAQRLLWLGENGERYEYIAKGNGAMQYTTADGKRYWATDVRQAGDVLTFTYYVAVNPKQDIKFPYTVKITGSTRQVALPDEKGRPGKFAPLPDEKAVKGEWRTQ